MVSEPTRVTASTASTIDLLLMSNPQSLDLCHVHAPLANCDHNPVSALIRLPSRRCSSKPPMKQVWLYKMADRKLGQNLLMDLPLATESDDIDEFWSQWSRSFFTAMKRCIPCKSVPGLTVKLDLPSVNASVCIRNTSDLNVRIGYWSINLYAMLL